VGILGDERIGKISRRTLETSIDLLIDLDGTGLKEIDSNVPFLDHMLVLFAAHSLFDLSLKAKGDVQIDDHHTVEDIGICLGKAMRQAIGEKEGIRRYGLAYIPMDEALVRVALDISGRGYLSYGLRLGMNKVGDFDTELIEEFFRGFTINAGMTVHITQLSGKNTHHIIEAAFKAFAHALRQAVEKDNKIEGVLSTKGCLE
jgi:imidazoleglycerol-phosphate dehydratase